MLSQTLLPTSSIPSFQSSNIPVFQFHFSNIPFALMGLAFVLQSSGADLPEGSLRWNTNSSQVTVELVDLPEKSLEQIAAAQPDDAAWQKILSVYAGQGDLLTDLSVPPMLGRYELVKNLVRFEPKFPLEPGVTYRAVFRPANLPGLRHAGTAEVVSSFRLPMAQRQPVTVVTRIYPSADMLPENLLKFYVHFSGPMRRGHIYEHIRLLDDAGQPIELPFLEIDEELWNPEMTRLTLFIDPGRIKRGVQPLEEIGPALEEGKSYTLVIADSWLDAAGTPLKQTHRKPFKVGPPDREPIATADWKVIAPAAGSLDPVRIDFPEPLDRALALRMIWLTDLDGRPMPGRVRLREDERRWNFLPDKAWAPGTYRLVVQTAIEDLAGNNIGKPFEVDLFEGVQRRVSNTTVSVPFEVK